MSLESEDALVRLNPEEKPFRLHPSERFVYAQPDNLMLVGLIIMPTYCLDL
jgi:hypothetical protein